jgi:hypothetical protein
MFATIDPPSLRVTWYSVGSCASTVSEASSRQGRHRFFGSLLDALGSGSRCLGRRWLLARLLGLAAVIIVTAPKTSRPRGNREGCHESGQSHDVTLSALSGISSRRCCRPSSRTILAD